MNSTARAAICASLLIAVNGTLAADKNGVSPQVISLPSGPGSIQGLGESFQPQLNSGSGAYAVSIQLPAAATGFAPKLALNYHTGQGNGILGIGWKLSGPTMISRNIDRGIPFYVDEPNGLDDDFDGTIDNPEEIDRFSGIDLEELVPLDDGSLHSESESAFTCYRRAGGGWTIHEKSGVLHEFGTSDTARLENNGRVFGWLLERSVDLNGNAAEYAYIADPGSPGQKYLREVRWARPGAFYAAVLSYDTERPDAFADYRSGFEIRTAQRLVRIDVIAQGVPPSPAALVGDFNGDGQPDSLIRRYELAYETDALVSRLSRVTLRGADGVTSIPATTFQYTNWTPPHDVALPLTGSSGDPVAALDSNDVELIDMNQDGLPDLLHATQTFHRVYFNLGMDASGRLAWDTVGTLVKNAPGLNLGLASVHLADHTADGQSDLIHKVNNSTFQCYVNSGQGAWQPPITLGNTNTWPLWPFENEGSRTLDIDHNRLQDILFTGDNSYRLWMMLPGGRYSREVPLPILSDGTQGFSFEDPGARIADVNGDRINDLVWVQSTRVVYWASCGRGEFDGPHMLPLSGSLSASEIQRAIFADINGDGMSDLLVVRPASSPNGIHYFLNRGLTGFDVRRAILGLPSVQAGDTTRLADMNGNGSVDFVISNSARPQGNRVQFLDFVPDVRPNLLIRVDNGLGFVTTLAYTNSVEQMVRAKTDGQPWTATMPLSVPVVARISESDSRGNEFVRELTYRDPHYDAAKQEFRGFTQTVMREIGDDSAPTRITTTTFDPGIVGSCRKGMVLSREVTDTTGVRFERTENTLQHRIVSASPDGREVCFAFDEATDTYLFEQTDTPAHVRTEFVYDDVGNLLREDRHGLVGQDGDEVFVEKAFAYAPDIWLMDRPVRSTTRDGQGTKVAEELFAYDDRGNLLELRRWLNTDDRFIVTLRNEYDPFGNVIRITDANDHSRSVVYDPLMHTYPITETVHLETHNLTMSASHDLALGSLATVVDFAGAVSTFQYDPLGRLTAHARPGGALATHEYALGSPVNTVTTRVRESLQHEDTFDRYDYFDGYGRKLGSKIEAEDDQWRFVEAVQYNNRNLERARWLPYFTPTKEYESPDGKMPFHEFEHDVQGRRIQTINPDATTTRTVFEPLRRHEHDENDTAGAATPKSLQFDGLQRLVRVTERNGPADEYHTSYTWTALGDLIAIVDAQGNTKSISYDSLKRSVALHDPDRGTMLYHYDDAGNLTRTVDARGQEIRYTYDFANRLVSENYLDQGGGPDDPIDVRYVYDVPSEQIAFGDGQAGTATFTGGRLSSVSDLSGEEYRSYDARGNLIWTVKRIRDPQLGVLVPFMTAFTYDAMDRITEVFYPDADRCAYTYNTASFLETAGGGLGGQQIVTHAAYEPTGLLSQLTFGNGVVSTYAYDNRDRLASLRTDSPLASDLIHYTYSYDPVSNITRINDNRASSLAPLTSPRRNTQLFAYDDLHRLTQVRYSPQSDGTPDLGQIDYAYDKIGNMTSQSTPGAGQTGHITDPTVNIGTMASGGAPGTTNRAGRLPGDPPGPHALTATQSGGAYHYDDNGNMTGLDGATLTWDFNDRLVRFQKGDVDVRYIYDYVDRRIVKLVANNKKADLTLYPDAGFEYRPNRAPIKYVFNGGTRLARVSGTIDPARQRLQRIWLSPGWNLLTVAVQSLQTTGEIFGAGSPVYEWNGKAYRPVSQSEPIPVGTPLWAEVNSARVVTAAGLYDPPSLPVAIPSGQSLVAWNKLEPLVPAEHLLSVDMRIQAHDAHRAQWVTADSTLPAVVSDVLGALPTSTAAWVTTETASVLLPGAGDDRATLFYHGDHLGSAHALTDRQGALVHEMAYYPFGDRRHSHQPVTSPGQPFGFTQKEQDVESKLHYFEQRYLASPLGRFASLDPKYASPAALSSEELALHLMQPQDLNLYTYSRNNPIRYIDPTGLSPEDSTIESIVEPPIKILALAAQGKLAPQAQGSALTMLRNAPPLQSLKLKFETAEAGDAAWGGRILSIFRAVGGAFGRTPKTTVGSGADAFSSTVKVVSGGAETAATGAGAMARAAAPVVGTAGRSTAAEIARADRILAFVRSTNHVRLGMGQKEAAAHFTGEIAKALKQFPAP